MKKFSRRKHENPRSVDNNTTMLGDSAFGAVQSLELSGVVVVKKFLVKYENQNKAITAICFKFEFPHSILSLNHRLYLLHCRGLCYKYTIDQTVA